MPKENLKGPGPKKEVHTGHGQNRHAAKQAKLKIYSHLQETCFHAHQSRPANRGPSKE